MNIANLPEAVLRDMMIGQSHKHAMDTMQGNGLRESRPTHRTDGPQRGDVREPAGFEPEMGLGVVRAARAGLQEIGSILLEMRDLAEQAADGSLSNEQRAILDERFSELTAMIDQISNQTEYEGFRPLDGTSGALRVLVGSMASDVESVDVDLRDDFDAAGLGLANDISDQAHAMAALGEIAAALEAVADLDAGLQPIEDRLVRALGEQGPVAPTPIIGKPELDITARHEPVGHDPAFGIGAIRTARSGLEDIGTVLQRMLDITREAADPTMSAEKRAALDDEYQEFLQLLDEIAAGTEFGGVNLLDGSAGMLGIRLQNMTAISDTLEVDLSHDLSTASIYLAGTGLSDEGTSRTLIDHLESAIANLNRFDRILGQSERHLERILGEKGSGDGGELFSAQA